MIKIEELQSVGINYQAGLSRFMNDIELYEAVLNAFVDENIICRSQQAYEAGDYNQLFNVIHEAKGSSGNAGFDELYEVSSSLVELLRSKEYSEQELTELFQTFITKYKKVMSGVKAALSE